MRNLAVPRSLAAVSPIGVFVIVLVIAFAVEMVIMLAMFGTEPLTRRAVLLAAADASLLTVILSPAIWLLLVRPLRSLLEQRGRLLARIFEEQERERARLSRDLHDDLGQQLTAVLLALRAVEDAPDYDHARALARRAREIAGAGLESARRMARGLSPGVLTDLGLGAAVDRLCEDFGDASGVRVTSHASLEGRRLRPEIESAAFRVLQEAVTNAVRHSGASNITVTVSLDGSDLKFEVRDDGTGFPRDAASGGERAGMGIQGMRERVALLHGRLEITSLAGAGTTIAGLIPRALSTDEPDKSIHR